MPIYSAKDKENKVATRTLKIFLLFAASLVLYAGQALAKDNFCAECHTAKEVAAFGNVLDWNKSIYQEKNTICPGLFELKKEAYFTESRLAKYDEFLTKLEDNTRRYPEYMREDLDQSAITYADLVSGPAPVSISAFADPNLKIKKALQENVYGKLEKLQDDYKMEKVIGLALIGIMLLTLLMNFGLKNTLKD